ncbi:integrating conjugative element protein [Pantoea agglomerans]
MPLILLSLSSHAELNVLADLGGQSTQAIFDAVNRQDSPAPVSAPPAQGEAAMLPVTTPEMSPGAVNPRDLQLPGIGALFIIGDDDVSRSWLRHNAQRLSARGAVGLVVNVDSQDALDGLRGLAPGMTLAPASGSDLARRLQLTHYPVLITDGGLTQEPAP